MADFARLVLDADTRGLNRGSSDLDNLGRQSRRTAAEVDAGSARMGQSFRRIGLAVSGAASAALGYFAKQSIQVAMDAQEMQSAFEAVFGSMSEDMRKWAEATGDAMGRSTQEIQRGALAFQELFGKALDPAKAAEMSKQFAVLTQDLASFKNLSNEVAQQKLFSGLTGEAEPLRAVGVFLNDAAVKAKGAALGLGAVNRELTDQEKIIARAAIIQEQLAAAQGDVVRTSDSAANTIRAAQAAYEELQVTVGSALLPTVTVLARELANGIQTLNGLTGTLGITSSGVSTLISVVRSAVVGWVSYRGTLLAVQAAQVVMNSTAGMLIGTIATTTRVAGVAAGAQVAFSAATAGATTVTRALTAALIANPFTAVAAAVGVLASAMLVLRDNQVAARAETDNLIRSLRGLAEARSAEFALKRAEAVAEQSRIQGEILRLEGLTKRPGLAGSFAAQGVGKELMGLRQQLVEVTGEIHAADNRFKEATTAAKAMTAPVAQSGTAVKELGRSLGSTVPKVDELARSLQNLKDKAFPQKAALNLLNSEIATLNKIVALNKSASIPKYNLTAEEAASTQQALIKSYLDQYYGKPDVRIDNTGPLDVLSDLDKNLKSVDSTLGAFSEKAKLATVRVAESFKDMADKTINALSSMIGAIRGGGFLDILQSVLSLGLQLGSIGVFGKTIAGNINKTVGRNANGTDNWRGGLTWVGEEGPELLDVPRGARIHSNSDSMAMASGGTVRVVIEEAPGFAARVRTEAAGVAVEVVKASAGTLVNASSAKARRDFSRPVTPGGATG